MDCNLAKIICMIYLFRSPESGLWSINLFTFCNSVTMSLIDLVGVTWIFWGWILVWSRLGIGGPVGWIFCTFPLDITCNVHDFGKDFANEDATFTSLNLL
jgi:hypothetical protein